MHKRFKRQGIACLIGAVGLPFILHVVSASTSNGPARALFSGLAGQERNAIKEAWPGIGCWFWTTRELAQDGYKDFLDKAERHSGHSLLTTSIRASVEVTDSKVHDQIKLAAAYARAHSMAMVMDLDVRLARKAFMEKHPDHLLRQRFKIVRGRYLAARSGRRANEFSPAVSGALE